MNNFSRETANIIFRRQYKMRTNTWRIFFSFIFLKILWLLCAAANMADNVNNISRKRKSSDFYNNFGVDGLECSPSNSPEPSANILKCTVKDTEKTKTSTDVNINKMEKEEFSVSLGVPSTPKSDDLRCMDMEVDNSPVCSQDVNKPFLSVIFHDNEFANIYKSPIVNYIKSLVGFELIEECKRESHTIVDLWEYTAKQTVNEKDSNELFSVDTTPSKGREITALPKYSTNSSVIEEFDPNKPNGDAGANKSASTQFCFNCDGNHAIRDCQEARDYRRINMARNKYLANAPAKTTRYHLDDEQKFKHLVPGKISEKLKKALNVRKHEVPSYIYRMRMFGYPPGWLEEARVTNSSLELFDFQGCSVEESNNDKKIIDANKIIEYPGFNVPLEKGDIDDYKYFRCPAYSEQFSKKTMLEYIENYAASQRTNNSSTAKETSSKFESDSNSQESESTDRIKRSASPTLNDLELRKRQLLAELEDGCTSSPQPITTENNETIKEPEIKSVEVKDGEVVKEIEDIKKGKVVKEGEDIKESEVIKKGEVIKDVEDIKDGAIKEGENIEKCEISKGENIKKDEISKEDDIPNEGEVIAENKVAANTETKDEEAIKQIEVSTDPETKNTGINEAEMKDAEIETTVKSDVIESPSVVSSTYGTPILKTASPFSQLPDRDKWSKDISQVINFENLPNSTGKYEQMTKVISKVRSIVKGVVTDDENKS